jgi:hypothetical protein
MQFRFPTEPLFRRKESRLADRQESTTEQLDGTGARLEALLKFLHQRPAQQKAAPKGTERIAAK